MAGDVDADDAADDGRIVRHAAEANLRVAVVAERILRAVVGAARVREARFVHDARCRAPWSSRATAACDFR